VTPRALASFIWRDYARVSASARCTISTWVWGSEISSGGNRVGIEQAAEPRASTNNGARTGAGLAPGRIGKAEMATAMRALIVVMRICLRGQDRGADVFIEPHTL
jgi:hypothetical protein